MVATRRDGIGPCSAKLLKAARLKSKIGHLGTQRSLRCQVIYCRDKLGIPNDRLNVSGGATSIGHSLRHVRRAA